MSPVCAACAFRIAEFILTELILRGLYHILSRKKRVEYIKIFFKVLGVRSNFISTSFYCRHYCRHHGFTKLCKSMRFLGLFIVAFRKCLGVNIPRQPPGALYKKKWISSSRRRRCLSIFMFYRLTEMLPLPGIAEPSNSSTTARRFSMRAFVPVCFSLFSAAAVPGPDPA